MGLCVIAVPGFLLDAAVALFVVVVVVVAALGREVTPLVWVLVVLGTDEERADEETEVAGLWTIGLACWEGLVLGSIGRRFGTSGAEEDEDVAAGFGRDRAAISLFILSCIFSLEEAPEPKKSLPKEMTDD